MSWWRWGAWPRRARGLVLRALLLVTAAAAQTDCATTRLAAGAPRSASEIAAVLADPHAGVLVAAHRGAHCSAPENSLASIETAIQLGADIVEIDIRTTADGVLVLMHDDDVNRTTTGRGDVKERTYAELRRLRLKRAGRATAEPPPTLAQALRTAKGRILVDLDIKDALPRDVLRVVRACGALEEVVFFNSCAGRLERVVDLEPGAQVMPRGESAEEALRLQARFDALLVHGDPGFASEELADRLAEKGARLWVNSLGWRDAAAALGLGGWVYGDLVRAGATVIQTDRPAALLGYLRSAGRRP